MFLFNIFNQLWLPLLFLLVQRFQIFLAIRVRKIRSEFMEMLVSQLGMFSDQLVYLSFFSVAQGSLWSSIITLEGREKQIGYGICHWGKSITTVSQIPYWLLSEGLGIFFHIVNVSSQEIRQFIVTCDVFCFVAAVDSPGFISYEFLYIFHKFYEYFVILLFSKRA